MRSALSALASAIALSTSQLESLQSFFWAPGLAFALLVVTARSRKPELLVAVLLSYTIGYSSNELLEGLGVWPMRIGVVAIGSGLLTASLHWKGGLSLRRTRELFVLGTLLAVPFWLILTRQTGAPSLPVWFAGFAVWQMPVAWYYLKES